MGNGEGNPAVLTLAEADAELQRLALLKKNHVDEQYVARRNVRDLPGRIASLSERIGHLNADEATVSAHAGDPITINGREYSHEDAAAVVGKQLDPLPREVRQERRIPLGIYRGLRFGIVLHPEFPPEVYLEGATTRHDRLIRGNHGPRAVLNALDRLCNAYGYETSRIQQDLSIAEAQLRDYQARLGNPFLHEAYQAELTTLRDQLKAGLAGTAPQSSGNAATESSAESRPTITDLADRIKALKAEHTIEATPERTGIRRLDAEEPITARIRRRAATSFATDPAMRPDAAESAAPTDPDDLTLPGTASDQAGITDKLFHEQIADQRRWKDLESAGSGLQR